MQRHTNPAWRNLGTGRHVGLEIELVHPNGSEALDNIRDIREFTPGYVAAAKLDGSVSGVEFVTQPASFKVHSDNLSTVLRDMREQGFFANQSCGLHIHVERRMDESNSDLVIKKLVTLLNLSCAPWDALFRSIYGRAGTRWAGTLGTRSGKFSQDLARTYENDFVHSLDEKFLRLNVLHGKTLEFRQGAGTANKRRIMLRIEASLALIRFAKYISVDKLNSADSHEAEMNLFKKWVRERANKYRRLAALLQSEEEMLLSD